MILDDECIIPSNNWPAGLNDISIHGWAGELTYNDSDWRKNNFKKYKEMVDWIKLNVYNAHSNVLWSQIGGQIIVKFRKEKDMMWFILRFGS